MGGATAADSLTLGVGGRALAFPAGRPVSVGAHRFCDVVVEDPEGGFPLRAAVFDFADGGWVFSNACNRHVVLHADGHAPLSLPPGGRVALTGAPFVISVPGTATSVEVPVSFGTGDAPGSGGPGGPPWLRPAGSLRAPDVLARPAAGAPGPRQAGAVLALSLAILLLLSAGGITVVQQGLRQTAAARPEHPEAWDPRIADLVAFVEKDRELPFREPVFVDFMTPEAFEAAVGSDVSEAGAEERREMERVVGEARALGLLEGDVDLFAKLDQLNTEGTLAFYSPETERVSVRGTELTLSVRATLVHELTHVAQDQHFDLGRIEDDEAGWLRTVVEGDAERVLSHWVDQLDPATKAAYDAEGDTAEAPDLAGIPEVLLAFFGAPYEFGYGFVEALTALGGNPSIDRALQNPPVSDEQVFDPFRYLARDVPLPVQAPVLRRGESKTGVDDGIPDDFGALTLFLMLSQRVDHREALRAVDGWGGDSYIGFERDGRRCVRLAVKGDTPADTDELTGTLDAWARSMPEGTASVKAHGGQAELTTCDPGPEFKLGAPQLGEAMSYPLLRTGAAIGLVGSGISWEESRCVAGGLSQRFTPDEFSMEGARGRAVKRAVQELVASCPP